MLKIILEDDRQSKAFIAYDCVVARVRSTRGNHHAVLTARLAMTIKAA
ncbi:MAG: hypothetical protein J6W29_02025 [Neisseriaceae bacterium]|nr:hypothetical protein [Neisseriaceae bacterium]